MEYIKAISNKEELEGTCYFEFQVGKFDNQFWCSESLYIHEYPFHLIQKRIEKYVLNFDYYGVTVVHKNNWQKILNDFQNILPKISQTQSYTELNKILTLQDYYEKSYSEKFNEIKKLIYKMIEDIIIWLEANSVKHSLFSILGM